MGRPSADQAAERIHDNTLEGDGVQHLGHRRAAEQYGRHGDDNWACERGPPYLRTYAWDHTRGEHRHVSDH
ncbi:hypothetical protein D3C81_1089790 [compost metagenome]